ncbi:leucine-rich repeat protein [Perkinsela sp. CCAP 1560/4]|nr:leucine-rich repeat protein [Perkinsela sp. CCAP 1560/4]|eukprot:KNH08505.1 leucine-rich repeat protein [Perkinsela sp. CCAP 1560/4]
MWSTFIVCTVESTTSLENAEWQRSLMTLFFRNIQKDGMHEFPDLKEYCDDWQGIRCAANVVREIKYNNVNCGNFDINALPNAVTKIWISLCRQTSALATRTLPRNLMTLYIGANRFHGRVDLTTLPPNLQNANFAYNNLTGPIDLTKLPRSLVELNLMANRISQHTVRYGNLPHHIKSIQLVTFPRDARLFREIRAIESSQTANPSIFPGINQKQIF